MSIRHVIRFKNLSAPDKGVLNRTRDEVKSTGYVVDSYEAAKWCAGTSNNYSEAVLKAVNLGGRYRYNSGAYRGTRGVAMGL